MKVTSWESLVNKLNSASSQTTIIENKPQSNQVLTDNNVEKSEANHNNINKLTVVLEPDVAEITTNSEAVNQGLRFLIRVTIKILSI